MRRENVIGATLALLVLAGLIAHWGWTHRRSTFGAPFTAPSIGLPTRPSVPITAPAAPDDEETTRVRASIAPSGVALDRLLVLYERGGQRIYAVVVRGSEALTSWRALRAQVGASGRWPVVLGDGEAVMRVGEMRDYAAPPDVILSDAHQLDVDAWLRARHAQFDAYLPHGAWPMGLTAPEQASLTIGTDILSGAPLDEVAIALLPTPDPTQAAAWLPYGNFNDCPDDAVHVALFRRWRARYGAEIYGVTGDVVEMIVSRPPQDRASALELAEEQGAFDYDVVAQGVETVEGLAATLMQSTTWYFWWD